MSYENDLVHEYPQHKERIHVLKMTNAHFKRLFDEYDAVGKELHRIRAEVETPDDAYVEQCKKMHLFLKDELSAMLKQAA
ncbi:MAG: GTP-binding protein [Alphaproteobacteria bacterium]|nr:GTP-binding protein [Alphaproteobacteria bacterium]